MNNMPSFAIGMADHYEGPIEDPAWLGIARTRSSRQRRALAAADRRGHADGRRRVRRGMEVRPRHHGAAALPDAALTTCRSCPVNINCQGPPLTPLHRAWAFGEALRRACDAVPERIALVGTGGISHWPATPDSGKINEAWDREFLDALGAQRPRGAARLHRRRHLPRRRAGRLRDPHLHHRCRGGARPRRTCSYYAPIPIFAVGCTIAVMDVAA